MPDDRYQAHARRIDLLRRAAPDGQLRDYWTGYRAGMVRSLGEPANDREAEARGRLADEAVRGDARDESREAWGCGYHDGQRWSEPSAHLGLLRLVIRREASGSVRGAARQVLGIDERSMRRYVAGETRLGADLHAELMDRLLA